MRVPLPALLIVVLLMLAGSYMIYDLKQGQGNQNDYFIAQAQFERDEKMKMEKRFIKRVDSANNVTLQEVAKRQVVEAQYNTIKEVFKDNPEMLATLKAMNVKMGRLQNYTQISVSTSGELSAVVKDSILPLQETIYEHAIRHNKGIPVDTTPRVVKVMDFSKPPYLNAKVIQKGDSGDLTFSITNTLDITYSREPVKGTGFLGLFRKKRLDIQVKNANPYTTTNNIRSIQKK